MIFKNTEDFLKQMRLLEVEYSNINHYINSIAEVRAQLNYLKKTEILTSSGFLNDMSIKLTIRDNKKNKHCITYKFKNYRNYREFKDEINKI